MTVEAQRLAIARFCGWRITEDDSGRHRFRVAQVGTDLTPQGFETRKDAIEHGLPYYLEDVSACHQAEKYLGSLREVLYVRELKYTLRGTTGKIEDSEIFQLIHATPAQRCKAFLKVIGEWDSTK